VVAIHLGPVAAADKEEMLQLAGLDRRDDLVRQRFRRKSREFF
jgi:hypothetical protein